MVRILHVAQATTEGVSQYVAGLLRDQTARGWDVALACPQEGELAAQCEAIGAHYNQWEASRDPGLAVLGEARRLRGIVKALDPEVVHLHSSKAGLVGRLVLRGSRPTLFSPHAWSFLHGGLLTRRLALTWERTAARWTDVLLSGSEGEHRRGSAAGVQGTWAVVPNGIDLDTYLPADASERDKIRSDLQFTGPTVVCVGRLAPQKGQDILIAAGSSIRHAVPDAEIVLVGDGPDRAKLEGTAPTEGVRFVGTQPDVRPWLVAADVIAQPSRWEGMSMVALEALAVGGSLVASDVDGMSDAIGSGADAAGCVVPVEDPQALAAAVTERLQDPDVARAEGRRARARSKLFGLAAWGDRVAAIVEAATRGKA